MAYLSARYELTLNFCLLEIDTSENRVLPLSDFILFEPAAFLLLLKNLELCLVTYYFAINFLNIQFFLFTICVCASDDLVESGPYVGLGIQLRL